MRGFCGRIETRGHWCKMLFAGRNRHNLYVNLFSSADYKINGFSAEMCPQQTAAADPSFGSQQSIVWFDTLCHPIRITYLLDKGRNSLQTDWKQETNPPSWPSHHALWDHVWDSLNIANASGIPPEKLSWPSLNGPDSLAKRGLSIGCNMRRQCG